MQFILIYRDAKDNNFFNSISTILKEIPHTSTTFATEIYHQEKKKLKTMVRIKYKQKLYPVVTVHVKQNILHQIEDV